VIREFPEPDLPQLLRRARKLRDQAANKGIVCSQKR
jgi:hypothetical protein